MKRTILKAIACAALLFYLVQGAVQADVQPRIIGGASVNISLFPSTVALISNSIFSNKNSLHRARICGGTLISSTWVLTAAHCVVEDDGTVSPPSKFSILAGSTDLSAPVTSTIQVARVIVHEKYQRPIFGYDIALLQLAAESPAPAIARNDIQLPADQNTFIVGWGTMVNDGSGQYPQYLQSAIVPTVEASICATLPGNYQHVDVERQICAGYPLGGVDTCSGDSGGPLYSVTKGNTLELAGITSWGTGCAFAYQPGIYTDVAAYKSWIDEAMSESMGLLELSLENSRKPDETFATNPDSRSSNGGGGASILFAPLLLLCLRFKGLKTA